MKNSYGSMSAWTSDSMHCYSATLLLKHFLSVSTIELIFNLTKAKWKINVTISFAKNAFKIFQDYTKTRTDQLVF